MKIHVDGIILRFHDGPGHEIFFCQYPVVTFITKILCRGKPSSALILDAKKRFLCIILVNRVPKCVVHKLDDVRGGEK